MLLLFRKPGQSITIQPAPEVDLTAPLGTFFENGPIQVLVNRIIENEVKLGIQAHPDLMILREEISPHYPATPPPSPSGLREGQIRAIVARNLSHYRHERQWSTQQLAEQANLPLTTITAMEQGIGTITLDDLDRVALALDLGVAELLRE
ncbi:carbon storage regulator [Thiohalophilus sp.]|uniref:carbon storage regulator n=1 Tax=Thiohalophilus sp. TaxID=3028392 RepID=UPI002ACD3C82|nr:carbon storage regulator [Thiohalophilus sp.]MDZ7803503.1 carbon storage regulator [Thiohalophilus sp.]